MAFIACTSTVFSQNNTTSSEKQDTTRVVYEEMPSFPGGQKALMDYLSKNIVYPVKAAEKNIQGRVIIRFSVDLDGSLSDITIVHSVDPALDAEAIRLVKTMPKWIPGTQDGQPVKVNFTLPITFSLSNATPSEKQTSTSDAAKEPASFPGGLNALMEYLNRNIVYPVEAANNSIQGIVKVQFNVETDGSINNVTIAQSIDPALDAEAIRLVEAMPKWTPAKQDGQPVRDLFVLPVKFALTK